MKAYEKRKIARVFWANQQKNGKTNDAATGNWGNAANATISNMNQAGASHGR